MDHPSPITRSAQRIGFLLQTYVLLLALRQTLNLPLTESKLQPPELVFGLLGPLAIWHYGRRLLPPANLFLGGTLLYLGVLTVSALRHPQLPILLEAAGRWYLLLLFAITAAVIRRGGRAAATALLRAWTLALVIAVAVAYVGYALALLGYPNAYVRLYENYPYFGTVYRAASTVGGPTPLAIFGALPLIWHYRRWRTGHARSGWLVAVVLPILLLTFAKEMVLVALGCALVDPLLRRARVLPPLLVLLTAGFYWSVTHYLVEPPRDYAPGDLSGVVFNSGRVVYRTDDFQLTETSYAAIKRACLDLGNRHPWLGVGPDRTPHYLPAQKTAGVYPAHLPAYIPHSTYFGAVGETGWLGLAGVLLLVAGAWRITAANLRRRGDDVDLALLGFLVLLLVGGVAMDLLHLRFVWLALGLLVGYRALPAARA